MELQCDVHRIAEFLADKAQRFQAAPHLVGIDGLPPRFTGDSIERPYLHGADSTVEQLAREEDRLLQEVYMIVACIVSTDASTRGATQELVDRSAAGFAC